MKLRVMNCLTVDLEPWAYYYSDPILAKSLFRESNVDATNEVLDLFDDYDVKTTFFVAGRFWKWYPKLIREIARAGHEIAFHTYSHPNVTNPDILLKEIRMTLEFISKYKIEGFRAPQMTISSSALRILQIYGFKYDSSIYAPTGAPIKVGGIMEVPVSTYPLIKRRAKIRFPRTLINAVKNLEIPFGSGALMGILKSSFLCKLIRLFNQQGKSAVLFFHPWQLYGIPKLGMGIRELLLKLPYRSKVSKEKLRNILNEGYFTTVYDMLKKENAKTKRP